jgi:hypothetical protein
MKIKNKSTSVVVLPDLRFCDPRGFVQIGVRLLPGQEIVVFDEDAERSVSLLGLIADGVIEKTGEEEPLELVATFGIDVDLSKNISKLVSYVRNRDSWVTFVQDNKGMLNEVTIPVSTPTNFNIAVTDGDGVVDIFANDVTITLTPSDGITVSPASGRVVNGRLTVTITASQAGIISVANDKGLQNQNLVVNVEV